MPRGMTVVERIGQRVGKLVVIERGPNRFEKDAVRACWICQCDCGNKIIVSGQSLSRGLNGKGGTRSCGCLMKEKPLKHGMHKTRIYRTWHTMRQRCQNQNNPAFPSYGGRGITVCEEWNDFKTFYADMGEIPSGCSLDRIDNSRGYSKENCRWATRKQQGNNRRTNLYISFNGVKKTLSEWSEATGLTTWCINYRLKRGWTIEKALTTENFRKEI